MEKFFEYEIKNYDTLSGISLQFKSNKNYIKKINKLGSDTIIHLKTLKIPINEFNSKTYKNFLKKDEKKIEKEENIMSLDILDMKYKEMKRENINFFLKKNKFDFEKSEKEIKKVISNENLLRRFRARFKIGESEAKMILEDSRWDYDKACNIYKNGHSYVELIDQGKGKLKID